MALSSAETANMPLLPRRGAGHYEVWYMTGNAPDLGLGFWLRSTLHWPRPGAGERVGKLWVALFEAAQPTRIRAVVRAFPWSQVEIAPDRFLVGIDNAIFAHDHAQGALGDTPFGDVAWNLRWTPALDVVDCLPAVLVKRRFLKTLWRCPNQDVRVAGSLSVGSDRFLIDDAPATQSHIIGRKHARSWCWGHAAGFVGRPDACAEFLTTAPGRLASASVLRVTLGDEVFAFTRLRDIWRTRAHVEPGRYLVRGRRGDIGVEVEVTWSSDEMVRAEYHDPDGAVRFCHNTELASVTLRRFTIFLPGAPWRLVEELRAPRRGCFEIGAMAADAGVAASFQELCAPRRR